jgi:tetratricopeptide (TPR) repeat protein
MAVSILFGGDNLNGASRLEVLERDIPKEKAVLRSQILAQAGQALLMEGLVDRSSQLLTKAINLNPENPELYLDRATARMDQLKYIQALHDLNQAIALDPNFGDAYLYRAYVKRDIKDIAGAVTDIKHVLELLPGLPVAVLERGSLKELIGDKNGARKDWETIIKQVPSSKEAKAARIKIIGLDEKKPYDKIKKSVNTSNGSVLEK